MKNKITFVIDPQDEMKAELSDIQGGRKVVGTIKCKPGEVTIEPGSKMLE